MALTVRLLGLLLLLFPACLWAGPPYLTDDPEPTDTGHFEIYAPLLETSGRGSAFEAEAGFEVNYGAARDLQLTLAVPIALVHDSGWQSGIGDVGVAAKYRFYHDERNGFSLAAFPGVTLPTASNGMGAGKVTALLPLWFQKNTGKWSLFGGGGYTINAGAGSRDYWAGGLAVTRSMGQRLTLGLEVNRQGADSIGGSGATSLGIGATYALRAPLRLLFSAGPTFRDDGGKADYHAFFALGIDY